MEPSMKLNPNNTWTLVEKRLAEETDPILRKNLELVLEHMRCEAKADIEGVVATLVDEPIYVMHDDPDNAIMNPKGSKDAVRAFYDASIVQTGAFRLELDCERVIVDKDAVVTEGIMRMAYPGKTLKAIGIEVDDAEAYYLFETRMGVVWPVDRAAGTLVGEEAYTGGDGFAGIADRKLSESDIAELQV
jgi:hypothetical protein